MALLVNAVVALDHDYARTFDRAHPAFDATLRLRQQNTPAVASTEFRVLSALQLLLQDRLNLIGQAPAVDELDCTLMK